MVLETFQEKIDELKVKGLLPDDFKVAEIKLEGGHVRLALGYAVSEGHKPNIYEWSAFGYDRLICSSSMESRGDTWVKDIVTWSDDGNMPEYRNAVLILNGEPSLSIYIDKGET